MKKITKEIFDTKGRCDNYTPVYLEIAKLNVGEALAFTEEEWGKDYHPTSYLNRYFLKRGANKSFKTKSGFENGISMYYCLRIK